MAWVEKTISSWMEFVGYVETFDVGPVSQTPYAFRGQPNSKWLLVPSFVRCLPNGIDSAYALHVEKVTRERFQDEAALYSAFPLPDRDDFMPFLAVMQHYGAPTRLLDWTKSPFVAAYFAVSGEPSSDGAIWLFHPRDLLVRSNAQFGTDTNVPTQLSQQASFYCDPNASDLVLFMGTHLPNPRVVIQQGRFTMSRQILTDHGQAIDRLFSGLDSTSYQKIIIPCELKTVFMRKLHRMNITPSSLFPGLDGLGRSAFELAYLESRLESKNRPG